MGLSELNHPNGTRPNRDTVLRQLMRPLVPILSRAEITEVAVNRPGELWSCSYDGWERHDLPELTSEYLEALARAMMVFNGLPLCSMASVVLPDGERGQIVRPPACLDGTILLNIRKHMAVAKTLEELEAEGLFKKTRDVSFNRPSVEEAIRLLQRQDFGRLEPYEVELLALKRVGAYRAFLTKAVEYKRNIIVAGKTGSGKTTLARSIIEKVPASERIVTIEDVHELRLPGHSNKGHLIYGAIEGRSTADECHSVSMRLSPDRIFLAELRGGEAWEYVLSLNTGHRGSVTTTHSNNAVMTFERLACLIKNSTVGRGLELADIRHVLHTSLDVIVYIERRQILEIFYDPIFSRSNIE